MIFELLLIASLSRAESVATGADDAVPVSSHDLFSQEPGCTDYHTGCMRVTWEKWRTGWSGENCRSSCRNPCSFPGKARNANAKPKNFDVKACEAACAGRKPIEQLLRRHESKEKCIVIHSSMFPIANKSPLAKEQGSYRDAMAFDDKRGDPMQKRAGGKCQWGDTPYHYQIDGYGNLIEGRSPDFQPDTNTRAELNTDGKINVVIEGDYRTFEVVKHKCVSLNKNHVSDRQIEILTKTVNYLKHKYHTNYVTVHSWLAETECPGDEALAKLEATGLLTGCPDDKHNPHKNQPHDTRCSK